MRRPATRVVSPDWVDRRVALFYVSDFPVGIDNERCAIRYTELFIQHSIFCRDFTFGKIAEEGNGDIVLCREFSLGRGVVGTDAKDLGALRFKFSDTSLVRLKFFRSTTGERRREKCQHDGILAFEIGKLHLAALGGRQVKVRCSVAYLQMCLGRWDSLREQAGRSQCAQKRERPDFHGSPPVSNVAYHTHGAANF
jgi:hypothetical protein